MKNLLSFAAMLAMIFLAWNADGATQAKKKAPVKKGSKTTASSKKKSASTARKSASGSKTGTSKTGTSKSGTSRSASSRSAKKAPAKRSAATWRNRQLAPSADRYREIQQALASKGYLKPEDATGSWNAASMDALKKFQAEQNLDPSGKINSLSLIALGLGPKREPVAVVPPPKPVENDRPR